MDYTKIPVWADLAYARSATGVFGELRGLNEGTNWPRRLMASSLDELAVAKL